MTETATWRREVEYMQTFHDEFGLLYDFLHRTRDRILGYAFPEAFEQDEALIPMISLEAIPESRFGHWRGRFMEVGPLGFANVISINLLAFRHAAEIPPTLAHEMCHWWDRPNTGHEASFWKISEDRIGLDRHGMKSMTWVRLEEKLPMEELSEIVLNVT